MARTLFVGNLSWETDEDSLRGAFERFGDVLDARVVMDGESGRSCGFGFVTYAEDDDAGTAVDMMDRGFLDDRRITVSRARDRSRGRNGYGGRGGRGGYGDDLW